MPANLRDIGLGVIGSGQFGLFALQQFTQIPGVKLAGMSGTHREAALATARRFGLSGVMEIERMLELPEVDLVYIASPPFLHHPQAMQALEAGKHVLVEKPTALTLEQADEMLAAARRRGLLMATDLMQPYNPLYAAVASMLKLEPLGALLHAYFENYAADEDLGPDHWFWDRARSGGIFVEHGVHFFDMFQGWLGPGQVESAQVSRRAGTTMEDQVQCAVRYRDGILVNFHHSFTQPRRLDRQQMRLVFERGDLLLEEWIPIYATIHGLVDEAETRLLMDLFPGSRLDVTAYYAGRERLMASHGKTWDMYQMIRLSHGDESLKMHRYGELLRALFEDQIAWIRDPSHDRRITERNGRDALAMAVRADALAHGAQEARASHEMA